MSRLSISLNINVLLITIAIVSVGLISVFCKPVNTSECTKINVKCRNKNVLCRFIRVPRVICKYKKVKLHCPRTCNVCQKNVDKEGK